MYVGMRTQKWPRSPGINVATHKSQSCCLGGAGGCAQGPVHCRWLCICLCIACGSQSSTSHACCRTARASLHLLKGSFGLRCDAGPFLGLWACMLFAFLHCVPCMYVCMYVCIYIYSIESKVAPGSCRGKPCCSPKSGRSRQGTPFFTLAAMAQAAEILHQYDAISTINHSWIWWFRKVVIFIALSH